MEQNKLQVCAFIRSLQLSILSIHGHFSFLPLKLVEMEEQIQPSGVYRLRKKEMNDPVYILEKSLKTIKGGKKNVESYSSKLENEEKF